MAEVITLTNFLFVLIAVSFYNCTLRSTSAPVFEDAREGLFVHVRFGETAADHNKSCSAQAAVRHGPVQAGSGVYTRNDATGTVTRRDKV